MTYREVSMEELRRNVGESKLEVIEGLITAIRTSHARIETWITTTRQTFPVIHDRGFWAYDENG
ncbi:hypothetical protein [Streptomyces smaragdinus]|nr:hypothetical protein [Streptomyces smaragdinus]